MEILPEHLIVAILLRLPVKSLLRFKSVCKLWCSLISDSHFAQSHFQMSSSIGNKILHLTDSGPRSIDFHSSLNEDSSIVNLNFPITPPSLYVWGSCRGFVLLDSDYNHFVVWNPSTGFYKRGQYIPMRDVFYVFIYGLGYDTAYDDYLVFLGGYDTESDDMGSEFHFFSMKANSWEKIEYCCNLPYMNAIDEPRAGLFLNGAIHSLAYRHDTNVELILAFNVTERKFVDISLPDGFLKSMEFTYVGTLGGYLSLSVVGYEEVEIWLMKEYGKKSSWTKSMVVSVEIEIPRDHYFFFFPLCLTESGEIVGLDCGKGILKCNDKGKVVEYRDYIVNKDNTIIYTESLLSLPCDSGKGGVVTCKKRRTRRRGRRMNKTAWGMLGL